MSALLQRIARDVRFAWRALAHGPRFVATAVLSLALGIGGTTAIFSVVYATLLAPLPYPEPDQLVVVWSKVNGDRASTSVPDYQDWKAQATSFQGLGTTQGEAFNLSSGGEPIRVEGVRLTVGFLEMFGEKPWRGRFFTADDARPGHDRVAVITHRLWQNRFGGRDDVVGREIRMNGEPFTLIGVRPPGQPDRLPHQILAPLVFTADSLDRRERPLIVFGRLKDGVSREEAQAEMAAITGRLANAYPDTNRDWTASVEGLKNNFLPRDAKANLWLLMGAVGLVLLIACANVANLLLARASVRRREVAIRGSIGATPGALFGQLLAESLMLAGAGGALGVALGWGLLRGILALLPPLTLPSEADVGLNFPVVLFTVGTTAACGVLFGCVPALQAARLDVHDALREGGRSAVGAGRHGLRRALVVTEFALATTLLSGAGLAIHSFWNLAHVDLGVRTDSVLTFSLPLRQRFESPARITAYYGPLLERLRALPGVTAVSASTGLPLEGQYFRRPIGIDGQPVPDPSTGPNAGIRIVTPGYFETFGAQVSAGRTFTDADRDGAAPVALVNETFVRRYLQAGHAVGQRIRLDAPAPGVNAPRPPTEWEIVGVFRDIRSGSRRDDHAPEVYLPFAQVPWPDVALAVRTAGEPGLARPGIAAVVRALDPELPMASVRSLDQVAGASLSAGRFNIVLFGGFAAVALILAAVGIYGVMAFTVSQRTHEIGLRMALGAVRGDIARLVLTEGLTLSGLGLVLGFGGFWFVGRVMEGMLFGIGRMDPTALGVVGALLVTAALLACLLPARRATAVDPLVALRD